MKPVISALPLLQPAQVIDITTGEILSAVVWSEAISSLLVWVQEDATRVFNENKTQILAQAETLAGSANSFARQRGYRSSAVELEREIKAKSRLNELVLHKLMSETAAYVRNTNPRKQPHSFSATLNLGAVDKQMAKLEKLNNELILSWKCWDKELEFTFQLPNYILQRDITKISLPIVSGRGFIFTVQETPVKQTGLNVAGVDLGRKEPFTLAITNPAGGLIANYAARPQITETNLKRERLLQEVKHLQAKINSYQSLGIPAETLIIEKQRTKNKASRIGGALANQIAADITTKTLRHEVKILHLEDLRWASGAKYGPRWNHGAIGAKIEHTAARHGLATKRINPKNTSQTCHKCDTPVTHNTKTRQARCDNCKQSFDRDYNAAINIAKNKNSGPDHVYRQTGNDTQGKNQVMNLMVPAVELVNTT